MRLSMEKDLPIHDPTIALEATGGDTDLADILMDTCLEESPKIIGEAREAISGDDLAAARRCGHSLKSSFGAVGAMKAAAASQNLEFLEGEDRDVFESAIEAVENAFQDLKGHMGKSNPG